jgi:predicted nucleotidyltransferase
MISFIEENYESLKRLCKQYRVKRFEVFGSALTGEGFDPENSDLYAEAGKSISNRE